MSSTKSELREAAKATRKALSQHHRMYAGEAILEPLFSDRFLNLLMKHQTFATFISVGDEINTQPLIHALTRAQKFICAPKYDPRAEEYFFTLFRAESRLVVGPNSIPEPLRAVPFPPADVEVVFTPGLVFDFMGNRIGYGGGNYDRLLGKLRQSALRIGLCYDCQLSHEPLQMEPHDVPIDYVITEDQFINCRKNRSKTERKPFI